MNRTLGIILLCIGVVVLAAAGVAVKMIWFPSIKDAWFFSTQRGLRTSPPDLVFVRATRFPASPTNSIIYVNVDGKMRMAGRNVNYLDLLAVAYNYNPGLIQLPDNAPKNNFDFIVCDRGFNRERMQKMIQSQTGFSAHEETNDTDVLALKVADPYTTNLITSTAKEKQNVNFKKGRLYFTHTKLSDITQGLEGVLKTPVEDETGLTNYYDFSLAWSRNMNPNRLTRDDIDKIVAEWGLRFEPDTETIKMLVVKKVY